MIHTFMTALQTQHSSKVITGNLNKEGITRPHCTRTLPSMNIKRWFTPGHCMQWRTENELRKEFVSCRSFWKPWLSALQKQVHWGDNVPKCIQTPRNNDISWVPPKEGLKLGCIRSDSSITNNRVTLVTETVKLQRKFWKNFNFSFVFRKRTKYILYATKKLAFHGDKLVVSATCTVRCVWLMTSRPRRYY